MYGYKVNLDDLSDSSNTAYLFSYCGRRNKVNEWEGSFISYQIIVDSD
jgi:hypothetical protein